MAPYECIGGPFDGAIVKQETVGPNPYFIALCWENEKYVYELMLEDEKTFYYLYAGKQKTN